MRSLEKIENEIEEKNASVSEIQNQIDDAEKILSGKKKEYSKAILEKDSPDTLAEQRNAIHLAGIEQDGLEGVLEILQGECNELETEAAAAKLYATDAERHNSSMAAVEQAVSTVNENLPKLEVLVSELTGAIQTCFSETPKACSSLSSLPTDLDPRFSMEAFLNGQLEPSTDAEDRESLLDEIGQDLQSTIVGLQIPEGIQLSSLERLISQASQWRGVVESFQSGSALIRNRKVLIPQLSKRPRTERITTPIVPRASHAQTMDFRPSPRFDRNKPPGRQFVGHRESL